MKAIANLKKIFVDQVVVVWKPCAECPGESASQETYLLTSQSAVNVQIQYSSRGPWYGPRD